MIGLSFEIENEYGQPLRNIFANVNVSDYVWNIITDSTINDENDNMNELLFVKKVLNGQEFRLCIEKSRYYLVFVDLKAFPSEESITEIQCFSDFLNSDCQMILLCVDSVEIKFFCKDEVILNAVYKNCLEYGFTEVRFMDEKDADNWGVIAF